MAIAKAAGGGLTLEPFGLQPANASVQVVEADGLVHIADRATCLAIAARSIGVDVFDPVSMQDQSGRVTHFAVHMSSAGGLHELCRGATHEEAAAAAGQVLEQIAGSLVMDLSTWHLAQSPTFLAAPRRRKRKEPVFANVFTVHLCGVRVEKGAYRWEQEPVGTPELMKQDEALALFTDSLTLAKVEQKGRAAPKYAMRVMEMEGTRYAAYHDLVGAARIGVVVADLEPWPRGVPQKYVVDRSFVRYMRSIGWRLPWRDEEPVGGFKLHGRTWLRDTPIPAL